MNNGLTKEQRDGIEFAISYISSSEKLEKDEYMEFEKALKDEDPIVYEVINRGRKIAEKRFGEELEQRALCSIGFTHSEASNVKLPKGSIYKEVLDSVIESGKLTRGRELQEKFYPQGIKEARYEVDKEMRLGSKDLGKSGVDRSLVNLFGGR